MPGPAIHHIIASKHLSALGGFDNGKEQRTFLERMVRDDLEPIYYLGAQGPDFLFFNMNDWPVGGAAKTAAQVYLEVEDTLAELSQKIKDLIPAPLLAAVDALDAVADRSAALSEIQQLIGDVKNNIAAIWAIIETKILDYVINAAAPFDALEHPQTNAQAFSTWWWFDTLHIRRAGQFLRALLVGSEDFSAARAYSLGYLTHYAADVVGHPFVNAIAGGPYRTHPQRHKLVENYHDVWAYDKYLKGEFATSDLAARYAIRARKEDLPDAVCEHILSCIKAVYYRGDEPLYGKALSVDDLRLAHQTWLRWFTKATNAIALPPPTPYSITAELAEAWDKFVSNVGDIGDMIGSSFRGDGGILGLLAAIGALIAGPFLLAMALVDFILGELLTLAAAPVRFFLSLTYDALYNAFLNLRKGLTLTGFAFPMRSDLADPRVCHLLNAGLTDPFGHNASSLPNIGAYPSRNVKMVGLEEESQLVYPWPAMSNLEITGCTGAPTSYLSADPSLYIAGGKLPFRQSAFKYFSAFKEGSGGAASPTAAETFLELAERAKDGGLGNAVAFSAALHQRFMTLAEKVSFPDFSLDSDRGYAFKSWRKVCDGSLLNSPRNDESTNVAVGDRVPSAQTDILFPDGRLL